MTRHRDGSVRFTVKPVRAAREVQLVADFTHWRPVPMQRCRGNRFVADVLLPAGMYDYKFIIDGRWETDPDHDRASINPYGTVNSVVQVG